MKIATETELKTAEFIIRYALQMMKVNDSDLLCASAENVGEAVESRYYLGKSRRLHEICLNHRLALYIELLISISRIKFKVDIEYNRNYNSPKIVQYRTGAALIRPDILIHTRANQSPNAINNFMIIETKKDINSARDTDKIEAMMKDENYEYHVGVRIKYGSLGPDTKVVMYYSLDGINISSRLIDIDFEITKLPSLDNLNKLLYIRNEQRRNAK